MAAVIFKPPAGLAQGVLDVRVGAVVYSLEPGVPHDIPQEHLAAVQAAVQAATGALAPPAQPTVTPTGGAAGTYTYEVVAVNANGDSLPSTVRTITNGPTTLDGTHYNDVSWTASTDTSLTGYKVIRTAGGAAQGWIGGLIPPGTRTLRDNGLVATAYTPAIANPGTSQAVAGPPEI